MTPEPWAIFVEGNDDKPFVELLTGRVQMLDAVVHRIGGGVRHLHKVAANIRRARDDGRRIALVLDADRNIVLRRREVERRIAELSLPICDKHVFLLPDNRRAGNLETLLEELAVAEHRAVFDCLDAYRDCLGQASESYRAPGSKGRIHVYCEALATDRKKVHRNYRDRQRWDLAARAVEPLMAFLDSLAAARAPSPSG